MTMARFRLVFALTGVVLIVASFVIEAMTTFGATWFSGPMIGVGAVCLVCAIFPKLFVRNRDR